MGVLNGIVGRRMSEWLRHWSTVSVPEGLYTSIVGICVVILKIWICRPPALLVSGLLLSQLRMCCLNSLSFFFHPLKFKVTQNV